MLGLGRVGDWLTRSRRIVSGVLWGSGERTSSGVDVTEETAMQLALFYRSIQIRSETLGALPCSLYRAKREKGSTVYEEATTHPVHHVLRHKPNDLDSPLDFFAQGVIDLDLHGNWYLLTAYGMNGKLQALWRVPPSCVEPYWVEYPRKVAYRYTPPGTEGKQWKGEENPGERILTPGEIVHVKAMPATTNRTDYSLCGTGLLQMQTETIGLSIAARNWASDLFRNKGIPAGILSYRGHLTPSAKKELSENWDKMHSGENRYKTAVTTGDIEYKPLAATGQHMQVFETRQALGTDITVITGVPPAALGLNTGVTYSNTREQMRAFHSLTINQLATRIAKGLEKALIPAKQRDRFEVRFDLSEMMRGDDLVRAKYMETMVRIGAFSPNDVLAAEGKNPRPGGDVYTLLPGASGKQEPGKEGQEQGEGDGSGDGKDPGAEAGNGNDPPPESAPPGGGSGSGNGGQDGTE